MAFGTCILRFYDLLGPLFLLVAVELVRSENILVLSTNAFSTPSHYMGLSALTKGLVQHGHNVTLVTNDIKGTTGFPNGSFSQVVYFKATYDIDELNIAMESMQTTAFEPTNLVKSLNTFSSILMKQFYSCLDFWQDQTVLHELEQSNFDLVIVFPFSSCDVLIAHHLSVPFVVVVPSIRLPSFHEGYFGMPYPSSYVPFDVLGSLTDEMSFLEKIQNLFAPILSNFMEYGVSSYYHGIQVKFDIQPDKTIKELYADLSLVLCHVSEGNDFPRPRTPNYIPIGGLISRPAEPLPQDLEDFIQGSGEHGVIIFTLGSGIKGVIRDLFEVFARAFSRLPQRVLWRHSGKVQTSLGDNTRIYDWLPQNDILGHPKTRLLIYHGGSNGILESVYHGVPMVIIPLFGDQYSHAARIKKKGMGLYLDKTNITEDNLVEVIQEVINNQNFKERALHYSSIHHDAPMTPLERAVYWIEHVMKFGGDHLRPRSAHMGFIELYMIDVTVFLSLMFLIGLYVDYIVLNKLYSCCCKKKVTITKPKGE